MFSIKYKLTLFNIIGIFVSLTTATIVSGISVAHFGHESAENDMILLCENGKDDLNSYFKSVEQSVEILSDIISSDLNNISDSDFTLEMPDHIEKAKSVFASAAARTNGIFTYYYRLDPKLTNEKGFWFATNNNGATFDSLTVSDLTDEEQKYDWFKVPTTTGQAIWLNPYITENLPENTGIIMLFPIIIQ